MNPRDIPTVPEAEGDDADAPTRLGHFEIVGRLGSGGMGVVFEGRDSLLDRRVALKLLHPKSTGVAPTRLIREAQALAKLSHPNVVTVFEVAMAGDAPFVAMELVEGDTLAAWLREPRDWRAVLDVFIAVGKGLAAVHALGLVHRDFKPSNVLIDARGIPKLGDFGLVISANDETSVGSVMGTPAYMAPEQQKGLVVDQRADQYSFAKTLQEALRDTHASLQPILARAQSANASDRYPAMEPLLDALERVRRPSRATWIAGGIGVIVISAVVIGWGMGRSRSAGDPCPRPTERFAKVWSTARRSALETHFLQIDPALGEQRFTAATGVLDRGKERWMDQHVNACEVTHAAQGSDALLDRRMACLDRALVQIDDTVVVLERATDRSTLDNAMKAAVALPALDDCADVTALTELLPRPTNPVQRAEADALAKESVALDVALRTNGTKDPTVAERATAIVARARTLGDPETLARALRNLASVQLEQELGEVTLDTLREAITMASSAHDDRMVAELWTKLLSTLVVLHKGKDADALLPAAEAAMARTKSTTELRVGFLQGTAQVAAATGDFPRAKTVLDEAMKILDAAGANAPTSSLHPLVITIKARKAVTHAQAGEWKEMTEGLREVIPLANTQYGPDHPTVMQMRFNLGVGLHHLEKADEAIVEFREAARIGEARLSESPSLADYLFAYGNELLAGHKPDEAIPVLERTVAMARKVMPPGDPRLANSVGALAHALDVKKRFAESGPLLDENIAILEKRENSADEKLATAYWNRGESRRRQIHCDTALPDYERALALFQGVEAESDVVDTLLKIEECQFTLEQWALGEKTADRVIAMPGAHPALRAVASFDRGRARWTSGRRAEGIAEVRAARDALVKGEAKQEDIDAANDWLAHH